VTGVTAVSLETQPLRARTRWRYAAGLVVLAPFLAETVASGNTPAVLFPVLLPVYAVIYGLPALLVRELWVRWRIGWPGLLVLGLAYTLFNEGLVAATWFKLAPGSGKVLVFTASQALHVGGVNWAVAVNLVVFHTIFSLVLPIAVAEAWTVRGRGRPWLGRPGVIAAIGLIVLVMLGSLTPRATARACAGPAFTTCTAGRLLSVLAILALVALALMLPGRRPGLVPGRRRPRDRVLVAIGFGYALLFLISFFALPLSGNPGLSVVTAGVLLAVATYCLVRWLRAPGWNAHAVVLLATGALIPGMLTSLSKFPVGQPVAALLAAFLLWRLARRTARPAQEPVGDHARLYRHHA
jgi:hypothetical protein